jgi:hypothetical protein
MCNQLKDLVSRLTPDNAKVNNGVLEVAHSIFQRWRPLYRSDELFTEINHVLTTFAVPFLNLMNVSDPRGSRAGKGLTIGTPRPPTRKLKQTRTTRTL